MKKLFRISSFSIGFIIICIFILPAVPGYLITPDNTTDANDIVPQVANQSPGFRMHYVRLSNQTSQSETNWLHIWLHGRTPNSTAIPVQPKYRNISGDSVVFTDFGGEPLTLAKNQLLLTDGQFLHSKTYILGTDRFGRDVLSRLILGARVSLFVGFISVVISLFIGTCIGLFAGYLGGRTDAFLSWLIAVFWSVPTLLIALGLSFVFGKGLGQVLVAIGLSTWVEVARVVRGQTMQLREKEFILAGKISGFSVPRILFRHILPNLKGSLTVLATTNFAAAILLEAGLSFLGLGIEPPAPSWGIMVKEHLGNLVLDSAYLAIVPGAAIMLLVVGFNLISMGLRDAFDSRLNIN